MRVTGIDAQDALAEILFLLCQLNSRKSTTCQTAVFFQRCNEYGDRAVEIWHRIERENGKLTKLQTRHLMETLRELMQTHSGHARDWHSAYDDPLRGRIFKKNLSLKEKREEIKKVRVVATCMCVSM
jgi:hypothetical protein